MALEQQRPEVLHCGTPARPRLRRNRTRLRLITTSPLLRPDGVGSCSCPKAQSPKTRHAADASSHERPAGPADEDERPL
jgi:hypothetical protein